MEEAAKLQKFKTAVFAEIDLKIQQMQRSIDEYKENEIKQNDDKLLAKSYNTIQKGSNEIRKRFKREVAAYSLNSKRSILEKRLELTRLIFNNVAAKLTAFYASPEYDQYLQKALQLFADKHKISGCEIYVSKRDFDKADKIEKAYSLPCTVKTRSDIKLGGFILADAKNGYFYDETIEEKLNEQHKEFIKHSEFTIS